MKRYFLAIVCCIAAAMTYAECITETGSTVTISRWYDFYTPVVDGEMMCWNVELSGDGPFQIRYNIDLDQYEYKDLVCIYEIGTDGSSRILRTFIGTTESGAIVSNSKKFKVEYYGYTGKQIDTLYDGFQLYFEPATSEYMVNHDYYVLGKLGVGTTQINSKSTLHVDGAIYGGELYGATKFVSDAGYITIGTAREDNSIYMQFKTDRDKYVFNKPIYTTSNLLGTTANSLQLSVSDSVHMTMTEGKVGIGVANPQEALHINGALRGSGEYGSLRIRTTTGNLEFGPMDSGNVRFKTNMTGYNFDKTIILGNGILSSATRMTFRTNYTNDCMTILTNGNVGIGTTNPNYKLDVAGTIRANEIIVNTTGADFVFADDYQLRPLSEIKEFIVENKHLPEIKSAQEMQENGIGINELQTQLLQKIEELTLYILQQEEKIQEQELRIKALEMK